MPRVYAVTPRPSPNTPCRPSEKWCGTTSASSVTKPITCRAITAAASPPALRHSCGVSAPLIRARRDMSWIRARLRIGSVQRETASAAALGQGRRGAHSNGFGVRAAAAVVARRHCGLFLRCNVAKRRKVTRTVFLCSMNEHRQVTLDDGSTILVRPLRRDDRELLRRTFERLSAQSRRTRFQGPSDE